MMGNNHQYIWRFESGRPESDLARKHIVEALLQAYQDNARKVVFGPSCATCRPEFHWTVEGGSVWFAMPQDLDGSNVKRCLISLAGLDQSTELPKQTEMVLDFGTAQVNQESGVTRMCWLVSMITPEGQITLECR